jgi:hypothetical protein
VRALLGALGSVGFLAFFSLLAPRLAEALALACDPLRTLRLAGTTFSLFFVTRGMASVRWVLGCSFGVVAEVVDKEAETCPSAFWFGCVLPAFGFGAFAFLASQANFLFDKYLWRWT